MTTTSPIDRVLAALQSAGKQPAALGFAPAAETDWYTGWAPDIAVIQPSSTFHSIT